MTLTKEDKIKIAEKNKDISSETIMKDIEDTRREIYDMTNEANHLEATPMSSSDARINHMRAESKRSGIKERIAFIEKLEGILEIRND